jgi:hypothetical protein
MTSVNPCSLPPDSGVCAAAISRFYFDAARGVCEPFVYGGCGGNENNFGTLDACYAECGGPVSEETRCEISMDCTVVPVECCGHCGDATLADLTAIRRDHLEEFTRPCQLVDCACATTTPAWAAATCSQGRCVAVDIRETEYTECTLETDCVLRRGLDCCENCASDGSDLVAVRKGLDIGELTCGALVDCQSCATEPRSVYASCEEGRCTANMTLQ